MNAALLPPMPHSTPVQPASGLPGNALQKQPGTLDVQESAELREAFEDFAGQTFFGQLVGEMRKTVGKPAYLHGGRAEEISQGQLDQVLVEQVSEASHDQFSGPMFELWMANRDRR